jgi:hypothetical protein
MNEQIKELTEALQDMVVAFGGGGVTESHSVRVQALNRACQILKVEPKTLAQPEQEPVAYRCWNNHKNADGTFDTLRIWISLKPEGYGNEPLYTAPSKREWVGLTEMDIDLYAFDIGVTANKAPAWLVTYARDIEAKLMEKNGG